MFVRFRETKSTLQVTLLAGRRIGARVRHEHIAALGSIKMPATIEGRDAFWRRLHETLGRLGNRLDAATQAKLLGDIHARVPLVTNDERSAHAIEQAEHERQVWDGMRGMLDERAAGTAAMAASATATSAADREAAADAAARAATAQERIERLRRGETVAESKPIDVEQVLREAGWTRADEKHAMMAAELPEGTIATIVEEVSKASRRAERATVRRLWRQRDGKE